MKPKSILIFFYIVVILSIFFFSVAVHELVHFVEDGFSNNTMCFLGVNGGVFSGWYISGSTVSEFLAYSVQFIFLAVFEVLAWMAFWKIYDKV